jgi:hypothetical protein
MAADPEILNFLSEKENIEMALKLIQYVDELKNETYVRFWRDVHTKLDTKIRKSPLEGTWSINPTYQGKAFTKDKKKITEIFLLPITSSKEKKSKLGISIGDDVEDYDYRFYYDIHWRDYNRPSKFQHPAMETIRQIVVRDGGECYDEPIDLAWKGLGLKLFSSDFLFRMNHDHDQFIDELVGNFWAFFLKVKPSIEEINIAISQKEKG